MPTGAAAAPGDRASRGGRRAATGRSWAAPRASTVSSSSRRLTISSANRGFPPERSATWGTTSPPSSPELGISAATSSRVSVAVSGSSEIVVALRRPPPQPGRRSSSSSRVRQTSRSGARTHRVRWSIRSSIPSSAQWMSSIARTRGRRRAIASTAARAAEKSASRMRCGSSSEGCSSSGGSSPRGMASSAALRSPAASSPSSFINSVTPARSFSQAASGASVSRISNSSLSTSASAQ